MLIYAMFSCFLSLVQRLPFQFGPELLCRFDPIFFFSTFDSALDSDFYYAFNSRLGLG